MDAVIEALVSKQTLTFKDIADIREKLFVAVHLNFVEGKPLTMQKASRLINGDGNFGISFGRLLVVGCVPVLRRLYFKQIKREIEAQIEKCRPYMNGGKFRLDGHVHYHMLPLVFDAMMEVIKEKKLEVSYIRFPKEELDVYRRAAGKVKDIKPNS